MFALLYRHKEWLSIVFILTTIIANIKIILLYGYDYKTLLIVQTNDGLSPHWTQFTDSLFCPLRHESDKQKYGNMLQDIYRLQFNGSCEYESDAQFVIFDESVLAWGAFSAWDNHHIVQLTLSLATKRKFYIREQSYYRYLSVDNGKTIPDECEYRQGMSCYFKAISNCSPQQMAKVKKESESRNLTLLMNDKTCNVMADLNIDTLQKYINYTKSYKVIHYHKSFGHNCELFLRTKTLNRALTETLITMHDYHITYHQFNALLYSFLFRLQDNINERINGIVSNSLQKYGWKSISNTISMAIRASDKCVTRKQRGEMHCTTMEQNVQSIKELQHKFNTDKIKLDTVIITSEDTAVIEQFKNLGKNWTDIAFIFNDMDVSPNTGNPWAFRSNHTITDKVMFDVFISMFSSLRLQMHAKYYVLRSHSNWINGLWVIGSSMHCEMHIVNTMDTKDDDKHCYNYDKGAKPLGIDWHCYRSDRYSWNKILRQNMINHYDPFPV